MKAYKGKFPFLFFYREITLEGPENVIVVFILHYLQFFEDALKFKNKENIIQKKNHFIRVRRLQIKNESRQTRDLYLGWYEIKLIVFHANQIFYFFAIFL